MTVFHIKMPFFFFIMYLASFLLVTSKTKACPGGGLFKFLTQKCLCMAQVFHHGKPSRHIVLSLDVLCLQDIGAWVCKLKKASVRCWLICGWSRKSFRELAVTLHPAHHPLRPQIQTKRAQGPSLRENSESSSNTRLNQILHQHMAMASEMVTMRFFAMASEAPLTILD